MGPKFCKFNFLDTDIVNTKNCSYCNKPFTEELWCKECINSLEKSAENGNKVAMFNLANKYYNSEGIEKNLEKAFHWYQEAAKREHVEAMFNLAKRYYNGEGTEENLEKAFHWCQKAAEKDYVNAMFHLAYNYYNEKGI